VGKDHLSIHITRLLDYLKSSDIFCPRKLFSGKNSSPEKISPENIARFLPQKSVLRPALSTKNRDKVSVSIFVTVETVQKCAKKTLA